MDAAQAPTENDEPRNSQAHTFKTMAELRAEFNAAKLEADRYYSMIVETKKTAELANEASQMNANNINLFDRNLPSGNRVSKLDQRSFSSGESNRVSQLDQRNLSSGESNSSGGSPAIDEPFSRSKVFDPNELKVDGLAAINNELYH